MIGDLSEWSKEQAWSEGSKNSFRESLDHINLNLIISVFLLLIFGDLSEWSNEQAWKVCIRATVSRVRIPQSPRINAKGLSDSLIFFVFMCKRQKPKLLYANT